MRGWKAYEPFGFPGQKRKKTKYQTCQAAILIAVIRLKRVLFLFCFLFKKKKAHTDSENSSVDSDDLG